jgi:hypothetical protein
MAKCSQCDKPAVVEYDGIPLCVEHHLKMQQATYLQMSMLAANLNFLQAKISAGTGGIIPPTRMEIPPPPFIGDNFTLNNINVSESTIGTINTGTVKNLDASITLMQSRGEGDLAAAVKELTQALVDSKETEESVRKEIAEQLEFLVAQATAEPKNRSIGVVKGVLAGIRNSISVAAGLITIWDKVEPLIRAALGT